MPDQPKERYVTLDDFERDLEELVAFVGDEGGSVFFSFKGTPMAMVPFTGRIHAAIDPSAPMVVEAVTVETPDASSADVLR